MKYVGWVVVGVVAIIGLSFFGLYHYKFFGPKFEGARREVFEATRSYNQAKLQELAKYRLEYLRAKDDIEKRAIASTIRHRFADYNGVKLPYELSQFLNEVNR